MQEALKIIDKAIRQDEREKVLDEVLGFLEKKIDKHIADGDISDAGALKYAMDEIEKLKEEKC